MTIHEELALSFARQVGELVRRVDRLEARREVGELVVSSRELAEHPALVAEIQALRDRLARLE